MNNSPCDIELINADCDIVMLSALRERGYKLYNFNSSVLKYLSEPIKKELIMFTDNEINHMIENIDDISFFVIKLCLVVKFERFIDIYIDRLKTKNPDINNEIATIIIATTKINICDKQEFAFLCNDPTFGSNSDISNKYTSYLFDRLLDEAINTNDTDFIGVMGSNIAILLNVTTLYSNRLYELCVKLKDNHNELKKLVLIGKLYSDRYTSLLNGNTIGQLNFKLIKMMDGIYIGNKETATNQSLIIDNDIKNIISLVSVGKTINGVKYLSLPIDDTISQNLEDAIDKSYQFIKDRIANNERILCHCAKGVSRSPAIVAAYLMMHYGWEFDRTLVFMKTIDESIRLNDGFTKQLKELKCK